MERIAYQKIDTLTPNDDDNLDFVLPPGFARWTMHIVPKGTGTPDASTFELQYGIGSSFYTTNPASSGTLTTNQDNVVTRTDQVSKVRLKFTNGATPPDSGIEVEVYGSREQAG